MNGGIDTDERQLDYMMVRNALQELVWAVGCMDASTVPHDVLQRQVNGRIALQWSKTIEELGEDCEDCK